MFLGERLTGSDMFGEPPGLSRLDKPAGSLILFVTDREPSGLSRRDKPAGSPVVSRLMRRQDLLGFFLDGFDLNAGGHRRSAGHPVDDHLFAQQGG